MNNPQLYASMIQTVASSYGKYQEARQEKKLGEYEAALREREGVARYAEATHEAQQEIRQGKLMQSQARATMASSGGVTTDPGAVVQLGRIGAESEYNALAALFSGESSLAAAKEDASVARYEASVKAEGKRAKALSTVLKGATNAYDSYKKWKMEQEYNQSWLNPNTGKRFYYGKR